MLFYYRLAGFNALISIAVNLIILLGLMAYAGATMTLPGIAGFILTIGMGVDSNVLIFERIKEELKTAKGVKQAVAAGFDRVLLTILDTHVASLISAAFLFNFGTSPIRGFALTLTIGLLANVFTAYFVSRTMFELTLSRRQVQQAFDLIYGPLRKRKLRLHQVALARHRACRRSSSSPAWPTASSEGIPLGIDFSGGTILVVKFEQPVSDDQVRQALVAVDCRRAGHPDLRRSRREPEADSPAAARRGRRRRARQPTRARSSMR